MLNTTEKVVLITGAARRLGASIAKYLHARGCRIAIHYRHSVDEATALCEEFNLSRPDSALLIYADLLKISEFEGILQQVNHKWGQLDVLINNASEFIPTQMNTLDEQNWDVLLDTNLKAPYFLANSAAPYLERTRGCIINIADVHGERPMLGFAVYSISKAGLLMLTKALAREYGEKIRVNAVCPAGGVLWPEGSNQLDDDKKQDIIEKTALKRAGQPEDVAKAVGYFVFNADYVTGQILAVDGGRSLRI